MSILPGRLLTTGYSYDLSGNMLTDGANTYTYNAESEISTAAGLTYLYDGDGKRVAEGTGDVYWYGAGSEVLSEAYPAVIGSDYIYFAGKRIAWRRYNEPEVIYYAADMLGTTRSTLVAGQTTPFSDADYYPFGGERPINDNYPPNHFKFEGKVRDTETGNDDFGARHYNSRIGRWLSADWSSVPAPVPYANPTNPQTLNLYAMVRDNPVTFADLSGHDPDPGSSGSDPGSSSPDPSGSQTGPIPCTPGSCLITPNPANQTATMTITSTNTVLSTNANGDTISTTTRTTNTITVSTADANRNQVLGGTTTTQTTVANLSIPGAPPTTSTSTRQLNSLEATNAVGGRNLSQLQDSARPSFGQGIMKHKWGVGGAWVAASVPIGACILAEPCGLALGIGAGLAALGAAGATIDAGVNP